MTSSVDISKPIRACDDLLLPDTENTTTESGCSVSRSIGRSESTAVYRTLSLENKVLTGANVRMQTVLRRACHAHLRGVLD